MSPHSPEPDGSGVPRAVRRVVDRVLPVGTPPRRLLGRVLTRAVIGWREARALAARGQGLGPRGYALLKRELAPRPHRRLAARPLAPPAPAPLERGPLPRVSALLVTYNSGATIEAALRSVLEADYPAGRLEAVVVDNASADASREVVSRLAAEAPGRVRLVASRRNAGFGAGVNRAAAHARGELLLLLNPDARLRRETLALLVAEAHATQGAGFRLWEPRQQPFEHPKTYDPVTGETDWASGACLLIAREAFEALGGFDPRIFLYAEDVDLSWRARARGWKIRYVPRALVDHDSYADPGAPKATQLVHGIVSNGLLRAKFGGPRELAAYALQVGEVLAAPPLPELRRRLALELLKGAPRLVSALASRPPGGDPAFEPLFDAWNYEVRRSGAFYRPIARRAEPLVSVVVRTHARPAFLRDALASLRGQTYPRLEVVVVEDGAPTAAAVAREAADGLTLRYQATGAPVGRCRAGNLGLEAARGELVGFLDDDDLLFADHLEVLVAALTASPGHRAAYSCGLQVPTRVLSRDPLVLEERDPTVYYAQPFDRELLQEQNYIPIHCLLFERALIGEVGGFDEELEVLEDWDLWLRLATRTDFLYVPKTTCLYRVPAEAEASAARAEQLDAAYARVRGKHGLPAEVLPRPLLSADAGRR